MDRINGLSDEIISHILSFLPIKESALTSVLSKRWRYLFAFTPNLQLHDDLEVGGGGERFMDFVDGVLAVDYPLRSVSIRSRNRIESGHVTGWMAEFVKRGVSSLEIDIAAHPEEESFLVPLEFFTCATIVELKLSQRFEAMIPEGASLPSLKRLFLEDVYFYDTDFCVLGKLLSASPVLEELTIRSGRWQNGNPCRTLSSSSLKRLTIMQTEPMDLWDMTLDTPSLSFLRLSDMVPRHYPVINLDTLVEAKLDLAFAYSRSNPTNLIKGLRNVVKLELSSDRTSMMFYYFPEAIPELSKLLHLSIVTDLQYDCLPILLRKAPNLQTLVIEGPLCVVDDGEQEYELPPCRVKAFAIAKYRGTPGELNRLKQFISSFPCLELVKVYAYAVNDREKRLVVRGLRTVHKSTNCPIYIAFLKNAKNA